MTTPDCSVPFQLVAHACDCARCPNYRFCRAHCIQDEPWCPMCSRVFAADLQFFDARCTLCSKDTTTVAYPADCGHRICVSCLVDRMFFAVPETFPPSAYGLHSACKCILCTTDRSLLCPVAIAAWHSDPERRCIYNQVYAAFLKIDARHCIENGIKPFVCPVCTDEGHFTMLQKAYATNLRCCHLR